jgi:prepilin peptidase CpaA
VLHLPTWLIALWACSIAYFDARYRRIPNVLSLGAWVLGTCVLLSRHASLTGAPPASALGAAVAGFLVTWPGYALRKLGAGDVKFMVAIGLLTSFDAAVNTFLIASLGGGLIAVLWLSLPALASTLPAHWAHPDLMFGRWLAVPLRDRRMAFGTLLALGLLCSLWMERQT